MKFRMLILMTCLIVQSFLAGCTKEASVQSPQTTTLQVNEPQVTATNQPDSNNVPSYNDFTKLMENFEQHIEIEDFNLIQPIKTIFLIEKEYTFDKKDTLTVSGEINDLNPTQQLFIFENNDQTVQLYVRFSYTEVDMGKNLVSWESTTGFDGADPELLESTDMATYTYRNLIFTVTQNAKTSASVDITKQAVKSVLKLLEDYYDK